MMDASSRGTAKPSGSYSPQHAAPGTTCVSVGGEVVGVATAGGGAVEVALGGEFGVRSFAPADVTRWCAETSVLMEVTLETSVGDEVRIRTPMLVGAGGFCIALVRHDTTDGSDFVIAAAVSASAMARDEHVCALRASPDEARTLLAALESAAAAATKPR